MDMSIVSLKPTLNCKAAEVGITISAPMRRLPTTLMESAMMIATTVTSKKFNNFTRIPLT